MVCLHEVFQIKNQHFHLRVYLPISKLSSLCLRSNLLHIPTSANFLVKQKIKRGVVNRTHVVNYVLKYQ